MRQFSPTEPVPSRALRGFADPGNARLSVRDYKQCDVVFAFLREHVVGVRTARHNLYIQARLFKDLSRCALLDGLAKLKMPAGQRPSARPVRADALSEQDQTIAKHDDAYSDTWGDVTHGMTCRRQLLCDRQQYRMHPSF
jgi:hypothetical protein